MLPPLLEKKISEVRLIYPEIILTEAPDIISGIIYIISRPLCISEAIYLNSLSARDEEAAVEFVIRVSTIEVFSTASGKFVDPSYIPIGTYENLYDDVVEGSGVDSPDAIKEYLDSYRNIRNQIHMQACAFICKAFSGYTPRDVEAMSLHELAKNIVLAELIHNQPFTIISAEDTAKSEDRENATVMNSIRSQARVNDKILGIDFSKENLELSNALK